MSPKQRGVFITGTDTEVGKTFYTCRLLEHLVEAGMRSVAMKPVASGAQCIDGRLRNDDALQLQKAANVHVEYALCNPYCFEPAIAPHLAAAQSGVQIDLSVIDDHFQKLQAQADVTVVEGVGGWLVPLNQSQTLEDLAVRLGLPVVLVVGIRLGCINHALLSARAIMDSGLQLAGWVANGIEQDYALFNENMEAIEQRLEAPCIAVLPRQQDRSKSDVESRFDISWL